MLLGVHGSWKFRPLVDKNLRPNWTTKITLEAFEKVDEASADREHNVDDTLLKKLSYTQDQMKKSKIVQCTVRISQIMT